MIGSMLELILLSLASFRLTRLIVFDKITGFIRRPFFDQKEEINRKGETEIYFEPKESGIKGWIGKLLNCYWCTGVWVAIFLVVFSYWVPFWSELVIAILAVAGFAAIIESLVQKWIEE